MILGSRLLRTWSTRLVLHSGVGTLLCVSRDPCTAAAQIVGVAFGVVLHIKRMLCFSNGGMYSVVRMPCYACLDTAAMAQTLLCLFCTAKYFVVARCAALHTCLYVCYDTFAAPPALAIQWFMPMESRTKRKTGHKDWFRLLQQTFVAQFE